MGHKQAFDWVTRYYSAAEPFEYNYVDFELDYCASKMYFSMPLTRSATQSRKTLSIRPNMG